MTTLVCQDNFKKTFEQKYIDILQRLNNLGYEAYFVGGSVRDTILGVPTKDIDITTSATPEEVIQVFSDHTVLPIGIDHGTVAVVHDEEPIEITTFRVDGKYSDNRRPDDVSFTTSLKNDIERRDLTINAIAYSSAGLVDLVGGIEDINNQIIRAVGDANLRFQEDPLRIMRALRFASKLGFTIEEETERAIFENKELIKKVSAERFQKEFDGLLMGPHAKEILIKYAQVIAEYIPEIKSIVGFDQKNPYHIYDVWEHSVIVAHHAKEDLAHKLAGIFHDIGKPEVFTQDGKGIGHFYGHEINSEQITRKIMDRLRYSNNLKEEVCFLIRNHCTGFSEKRYSIAKYIFDVGPENYMNLIDFAIADDKGKTLSDKHFEKYDRIKRTAKVYLANKPILSHKDLDITAKDIMELGYKGKEIGEVLRKMSLLVISGHKNNRENQINYLMKNKILD